MPEPSFVYAQFLRATIIGRIEHRFSTAMTHSHKIHHAHYAVVGSGIAALRAAIELSEAASVLVLAKSNLSDSATAWAQGGIAVALSDDDGTRVTAPATLHPR